MVILETYVTLLHGKLPCTCGMLDEEPSTSLAARRLQATGHVIRATSIKPTIFILIITYDCCVEASIVYA